MKPGESIKDVLTAELDEDNFPTSSDPNEKSNDVAYIIVNKDDLCTAYTDITGRFPYRSSRGNQYILIAYHYDANYIYGLPMKDRKAATITKTWRIIHNKFSMAGAAPNTYILDNEISGEFIQALEEKELHFQLVPPHTHRRNLAERAIQTYKNHFKAGLASVDPNFPLSEWDRLLDQANITLNLLRSARTNPQLSAYTYICGEFNFAATPLAPPGTKIVAHMKPDQRGTWELNGDVGWYVGPSMNHYRCVKCYFPRTRSVRDCDTVTFFPTVVPFPEVKLRDYLKQAATDIVTLLARPPSSTVPILTEGDPVRNALLTLATQLNRIENIPDIPTTNKSAPKTLEKAQDGNSNAPQQQKIFPAPDTRVQENTTSVPRVSTKPRPTSVPTSTLLQHSAKLKNATLQPK